MIVLDANVFAKLFVKESDSDQFKANSFGHIYLLENWEKPLELWRDSNSGI